MARALVVGGLVLMRRLLLELALVRRDARVLGGRVRFSRSDVSVLHRGICDSQGLGQPELTQLEGERRRIRYRVVVLVFRGR